jgi:hypothetical protein
MYLSTSEHRHDACELVSPLCFFQAISEQPCYLFSCFEATFGLPALRRGACRTRRLQAGFLKGSRSLWR